MSLSVRRTILRSLVVFALASTMITTSATVASAATVAPPATYEESSSAVVLGGGGWTSLASSGSSGGAIRYSTSSSASAKLTFSGGWITWYTWKSPNAGIVRVLIDGVEVARVDNYAKTTATGVIGYSAPVKAGTHTISVVATGSKNAASGGRMTHLDSFVVGENPSSPASDIDVARASECPTATISVTNAVELTAALKNVGPGDVIRLADGTYTGQFLLSVAAPDDRPVWLCGSRYAVVTTGAINKGSALRVERSSNVILTGFTVSQSLQGVMVKYSSQITVSDMMVKDTGYEGVHFYALTTDSVVAHSVLARNGSIDVAYGEGVYIGTSGRRWSEVTQGTPDKSDRNAIIFNRFVATGAESIDAKEGTSDGIIAENTFEGFLDGSRAMGWVTVTGNDWVVTDNSGDQAVSNAITSLSWGDWGYGNEFSRNTGRVGTDSFGVWVHDKSRGVAVSCDNQMTEAGSGNTNVFCSR